MAQSNFQHISSPSSVLVVDDDRRIRNLLRRYLKDNGFLPFAAEHAAEARRFLEVFEFDALIVDIMMPGENGLDFVTDIREHTEIPVLMLTALGESDDRITGLEAGADDYLAKPFEPKELLLRLKSLLKRAGPGKSESGDVTFNIGRWEIDFIGQTLSNEKDIIELTDMESKLLKALISSANMAVTRQDLALKCGGNISERTIDVQVTRLRKKIETDPRYPRFLKTVRGRGYLLRLN